MSEPPLPNRGRRLSFKDRYATGGAFSPSHLSPRNGNETVDSGSKRSPVSPVRELVLGNFCPKPAEPPGSPTLGGKTPTGASGKRRVIRRVPDRDEPQSPAVPSASKSKKKSAFSSLLYSSKRSLSMSNLMDFADVDPSGSNSQSHTHSAVSSRRLFDDCTELKETPVFVLTTEYSSKCNEESVAAYSEEVDSDTLISTIDPTLKVTQWTTIDREAELERYAVHNPDPEGCCGCDAAHITKDDRGIDYSRYHTHKLFAKCAICPRRPASFLCVNTLEAVCASHVAEYCGGNKDRSLFINLLDITTSYDRIFWCERCKMFTWRYTDTYEPLTDQLAYTKGSYWGESLRDVVASEYRFNDGHRSLVALGASCQGWRASQEDAEMAVTISVPLLTSPGSRTMALFGVFDGHGGDAVAKIAAKSLLSHLQASVLSVAAKYPVRGHVAADKKAAVLSAFYTEVFVTAFCELDRDIRESEEGRRGDYNGVGSTACIVGIGEDFIVSANLGDSGAGIYCRQTNTITPLTHAHRLEEEGEAKRVVGAGYTIQNDRIEGMLAVPRALGDYDFKQSGSLSQAQQAVSCVPDVSIIIRPFGKSGNGDGEGIVVACDGVWDSLSLLRVGSCLTQTPPVETIDLPPSLSQPLMASALNVMAYAVAPTNNDEGLGVDNVTVLLIEPGCESISRRPSLPDVVEME